MQNLVPQLKEKGTVSPRFKINVGLWKMSVCIIFSVPKISFGGTAKGVEDVNAPLRGDASAVCGQIGDVIFVIHLDRQLFIFH